MFLRIKKNVTSLSRIHAIFACSPEIDLKEWCDSLKEEPKNNWSSIEAADFIKDCIL